MNYYIRHSLIIFWGCLILIYLLFLSFHSESYLLKAFFFVALIFSLPSFLKGIYQDKCLHKAYNWGIPTHAVISSIGERETWGVKWLIINYEFLDTKGVLISNSAHIWKNNLSEIDYARIDAQECVVFYLLNNSSVNFLELDKLKKKYKI